MVIRLVTVSDRMQLPDFHDLFRAILARQQQVCVDLL